MNRVGKEAGKESLWEGCEKADLSGTEHGGVSGQAPGSKPL